MHDCGYERERVAGGGGMAPPYTVIYSRPGQNDVEIAFEVHPAWHEITLTSDGAAIEIGNSRWDVERAEVGGAQWRVMPPVVDLYLTTAHVVLHNPRTLSLYLDVAVLLYSHREQAAAVLDECRELARANGRERHLKHAVTSASDLFGVEIPAVDVSLPRRLGMPTGMRLGYLGFGLRFTPSTVLLELAWRRGLGRKLAFLGWLLGHGGDVSVEAASPGVKRRSALQRAWRVARGARWLKGSMLRYRVPRSLALRS